MELKCPVEANPRWIAEDRRRVERDVSDTETPASISVAGARWESGECFAEGSDACSTIEEILADVQVVLRV
jgi:hypothetical protein